MRIRLLGLCVLSALVLSACGANVQGEKAAQITEAYEPIYGVTMEYPDTWVKTVDQPGSIELVPKGKDSRRVSVLFGAFTFGPPQCDWKKMKAEGGYFHNYSICVGSWQYTNSILSTSGIPGSDVRLLYVTSRDGLQENKRLFAFIPGVTKGGEDGVAVIMFVAHPDEYEAYLPSVMEMVNSLAHTR